MVKFITQSLNKNIFSNVLGPTSPYCHQVSLRQTKKKDTFQNRSLVIHSITEQKEVIVMNI